MPNFKDGAHIVLIITPGSETLRYGERDFFTMASFNAEISRTFAMLYSNPTLEGEFMYENMEIPNTPTVHKDGIRNPPTYSGTIPYSDIVFIRFDRISDEVMVVRDLEEEFSIINASYHADKLIDQDPVEGKTLRYIFAK
ncbi:MAG: hypothetical protein AB9891_09970 [Anaerolineaceae bacterium]